MPAGLESQQAAQPLLVVFERWMLLLKVTAHRGPPHLGPHICDPHLWSILAHGPHTYLGMLLKSSSSMSSAKQLMTRIDVHRAFLY